MATRQKPLRTLKTPLGSPDHFTIEEADAAVLAVMAERGETPVFDTVEEVSYLDLRCGTAPKRRRAPAGNGRR
jgi:hypothetical protein